MIQIHKTQNMKLKGTKRAVFVITDHLCDMENIYTIFAWVFLGWVIGVFKLYHEWFKATTRSFQ